jgi:hypothetical protein
VPEAGQGEQIQRVKVSDLGSTMKIWTMSASVDEKQCSSQG